MKGRGILSLSPGTHKRPREHTARCARQESRPQNGTYLAGTMILDVRTPEPWEINFCCLSHSTLVYYRRLRHTTAAFIFSTQPEFWEGSMGLLPPPPGSTAPCYALLCSTGNTYDLHLTQRLSQRWRDFAEVTKIPNTADFQFSKTENILMGLTWSDGPFKEGPGLPRSERPQQHRPSLRSKLLWTPQPRGQELCQQSEGAFPKQTSRWECSPAASWTTASWHPQQSREAHLDSLPQWLWDDKCVLF